MSYIQDIIPRILSVLMIDDFRPLSFIIGLAVTHALGMLIKRINECATKDIIIELPTNMNEDACEKIIKMSRAGGYWIGLLERTLYFIAFTVSWGDAAKFIAAILAFKIAAKWETWKNIVQVPQGDREGFPKDVSSFIFRRRFGERVLVRFLVGTFSNILFALIGYGLYRWFINVLDL